MAKRRRCAWSLNIFSRHTRPRSPWDPVLIHHHAAKNTRLTHPRSSFFSFARVLFYFYIYISKSSRRAHIRIYTLKLHTRVDSYWVWKSCVHLWFIHDEIVQRYRYASYGNMCIFQLSQVVPVFTFLWYSLCQHVSALRWPLPREIYGVSFLFDFLEPKSRSPFCQFEFHSICFQFLLSINFMSIHSSLRWRNRHDAWRKTKLSMVFLHWTRWPISRRVRIYNSVPHILLIKLHDLIHSHTQG